MTSTTPLRLYLIRHGETKWSKSGRHTGTTDIPLTEQGELEARELGDRLRLIEFSRIFSSPRQRARRTCELAEPDKQVDIEPDLAEWNYGDYEGKQTTEIRKARPNWDIFRDGCPGGESPQQVSARADRLITRLRALSGTIALFSHGQFGGVLAMRWIGLPEIDAEHFPSGTVSISILSYSSHHPDVPVVARWNAPGTPSFDLGIYPGNDPLTASNTDEVSEWENEGGGISVPSSSDPVREARRT